MSKLIQTGDQKKKSVITSPHHVCTTSELHTAIQDFRSRLESMKASVLRACDWWDVVLVLYSVQGMIYWCKILYWVKKEEHYEQNLFHYNNYNINSIRITTALNRVVSWRAQSQSIFINKLKLHRQTLTEEDTFYLTGNHPVAQHTS